MPAYTGLNPFYGTSAASAAVAAVGALILQEDPNLTAAQVEAILEETASPISGGHNAAGAGFVNAYAAVRAAAALASDAPLSDSGNTLTFGNIQILSGGAGDDVITITNVLSNGTIDLAAGDDTLILAGPSNNTLSVANVETVTGSAHNDIVTVTTAMVGGTFDLGAGADKLTLGNANNQLTIANVENLIGGTGDDQVVIGLRTTASTIDLGGRRRFAHLGRCP